MPIFYADSASFNNLEVTSSIVVGSNAVVSLSSNTSIFSGSFTGSFMGNGSSLTNVKIPVFKTTTDSPPITGTTANTLATQSLIPANSFVADEIVEIKARCRKTGTAGALTQRCYVNTANSLSGATLIGTITTTATSITCQGIRQMVIKTSTSTEMYPSTLGAAADDVSVNSAATTITNNWTVDQFILFSIQNVSATDSTVYSFYKIMPL